MANQMQIDEEAIAEQAELETAKVILSAVIKQNTAVLESIKSMQAALIQQGENMVAAMGAFLDAAKDIQITVNVPDQPAPVVNVSTPKEEKKTYKAVMIRNADGDVVDLQVSEK